MDPQVLGLGLELGLRLELGLGSGLELGVLGNSLHSVLQSDIKKIVKHMQGSTYVCTPIIMYNNNYMCTYTN